MFTSEDLPYLDFDAGMAAINDDADIITIPIIIAALVEAMIPVIE